MKLKRALTGILTGAMLVTNIPNFGGGGLKPDVVKAEETPASSVSGPVRYRAVPGDEMTVTADWADRDDAPLENIKSDAANYALSRYNTGGIPRSSQLEARNNIYIKLNNAADVQKLVWWADEDQVSNGHGWNVHNGTMTRCKISVTTDTGAVSAEALKDLGADKWTVQTGETGDVRLNSNKDDNEEHKYCEHADGETHTLNVAHDIKLSDYFTDLPQNITGIRIEVLNTAGTYTGQNGDQPAKDERDTYINGREIWVMAGEGKESKLSGLTAYADFETESGCGIENLVDGIITKDKKMSSLLQPASGETKDNGRSPWKNDHKEYFANNNIYIDIGETKTLGKLTYVPGTANGSIWRCNIYTSNVTLESGKPVDIPEDSWELAYTNVPTEKEDGTLNTSKDWEEYNGSLSALGNSQDAVFENGFKDARYVRMEVINTRGSGTENKWINVGRIYIYEAEAVYTGTVENAALSGSGAEVVAYTGVHTDMNSQGHPVLDSGRAINGTGNVKNTQYNYWVGTANLRSATGVPNTNGEVGYMVVDLGADIASVDLEEIQVRFHNQAWASGYLIQTSDQAPTVTGNVLESDQITDNTVTLDWLNQTDGTWTTLAEYPGEKTEKRTKGVGLPEDNSVNDGTHSYPLDIFSGTELKNTTVKRYVRIVFTEYGGTGAYPNPALRALEIRGIKHTGTLGNIDLTLENEPVYMGILRQPYSPAGAEYHMDSYDWYKGSGDSAELLDKKKDQINEGGTYTLKAKVATKLPLATLAEATIAGKKATIEEGSTTNSEGEYVYTVSCSYEIEDPTEARNALQAYINKAEVKAAFDTDNKDKDNNNQLIYQIRGWNVFKAAYIEAQSMIETVTEGEGGGTAADTVWYLKEEYIDAASALEIAFNDLVRRGSGEVIDTDTDTPDVTVTVPAAGESPARAVLTNAGNLENKDLGLVRERDHTKPYFHVDEHGYIHGRVTAPDDDPKNELFRIQGTTRFMINCKINISEAPTKKETIVGRLKGWGLQLLPQDNGSVQLFAFSFSDNNTWPQSTFTITDDNWYGQEHDLTAVFNGGYFQLYVDGEAGVLRRRNTTNEIVSGPLTLVDNSMFCIGYNVNPQNADNPEDFSGGMKDFSMYINKECLNDTGLAALETASSAESNKKETFNTALTTLLSGTDPDVTITGEPAKYDLTTKWELVGEDGTVITMPEGSVFERYRDYKVTVDVRAIDGYRFNKPQGILRTGEGDENILTSTPEETEEEVLVQLCYIFRGEEHPKETLTQYLAGIADELGIQVENNTLVNKDAEGSKKYTTAGWNDFVPVYNAAVEQSQEEKAWGADNNASHFASALDDLQDAVRILKTKTAAGQCECAIESIAFAGGNITLDEASAEITLNAACTVNNETCMKHTGNAKAEPFISYTCDSDNEAGASISENKLTVTNQGSVTVTATVQLKDGDTLVAEETADAVFTVASTPADVTDKSELDGAIRDLEDAVSKLQKSDYTPESWDELESKLQAAKDLQQALADMLAGGEGSVSKNQVAGIIAGLDINSILVKKEDKDALAKTNLQNAVKSADAVFATGSKDYTDAAWSAFEAAYKAAKAAPANADAETLKRLTDALVKAQAALNGAVKTGDTKTVDGMQYRVTNAGSKTVMLVKGKDAKSVTAPAAITIRGASYNVTAIGDQAFMNCSKIQKVTIGTNVTSIGKKAFFKCKKLKNVIFKGTKVKTIKGKAFAKTAAKVKVKMPKKLKGKQRSALLKKLKKAGMKVK